MKLSDLLTLRGVKRKLGKLTELIGAAGIVSPELLAQLPLLVDVSGIKLFALGVLIRKLGELHAKLEKRP